MLIFWPISSLGDAYKRYLSDAYKKNMYSRRSGYTCIHGARDIHVFFKALDK